MIILGKPNHSASHALSSASVRDMVSMRKIRREFACVKNISANFVKLPRI